MTIKSSGSLTFTEIVAEWTGSTPHSLSEYYSAGSIIYSGAADGDGNTIPASGAISFSDFYDTAKFSTTSTATASGASQGSGHNGGQSISSVTVPSGANAIYVFDTVAGGGGALRGSDHKGVGEDPGDGGGGGAAISAGYFTVVAGETLTLKVGNGGNDNQAFWNTAVYSQQSDTSNRNGGNTSIVGSSSGTLFDLGGGSGASIISVGAFKSLRTDNVGAGGSVGSFNNALSSGTTTSGASVSSVSSSNGSSGSDGAAVGENQSGTGGAGGNSGLGSGGGSGATNNVNGSDGTLGGGRGGGHSQSTSASPAAADGEGGSNSGFSTYGGRGGHGQLKYQFVRVV